METKLLPEPVSAVLEALLKGRWILMETTYVDGAVAHDRDYYVIRACSNHRTRWYISIVFVWEFATGWKVDAGSETYISKGQSLEKVSIRNPLELIVGSAEAMENLWYTETREELTQQNQNEWNITF